MITMVMVAVVMVRMIVAVVVMVMAVVDMVMVAVVMAVVVIGCVRDAIALKQPNTHQERQGNISFHGMKNACIFFDAAQAFFQFFDTVF